ncbi:MAG: hypothetical protein WA888_24265 [Burkholderiaceae bacterium]
MNREFIDTGLGYFSIPPELLHKIGALFWHYARPPIVGLSFEMDVRCVTRELSADSGNTLSP